MHAFHLAQLIIIIVAVIWAALWAVFGYDWKDFFWLAPLLVAGVIVGIMQIPITIEKKDCDVWEQRTGFEQEFSYVSGCWLNVDGQLTHIDDLRTVRQP